MYAAPLFLLLSHVVCAGQRRLHPVPPAAPVHVPVSTALLLRLQDPGEQPGAAGVCEVLARLPRELLEDSAAHAAGEEVPDLRGPPGCGGEEEEEGEAGVRGAAEEKEGWKRRGDGRFVGE